MTPLTGSPLPPDHEALAGVSDAAVRNATGRDWAGWTTLLDAEGAVSKSHPDIARGLSEVHGIDGWWAQTVTVGYERLRGLRKPGQRREGGFDVNRSATLPVPVARLFALVRDADARQRWAPDLSLEESTATETRSIRWKAADGTRVHAWFAGKGPERSAVKFQHEKLPDQASAEAEKARWGERVVRLRRMAEADTWDGVG